VETAGVERGKEMAAVKLRERRGKIL